MIGMLLETAYPGDIRVRKEAESLAEEGLDVLVIVPWRKGEARREVINGVKIARIGRHYSFTRQGVSDAISAIFFVNFLFLSETKKLIREFGIEHLHIHDLPLARTGLKLKSRIKGKLILDCHENYPELLEMMQRTPKNWIISMKNRVLFSPKRWLRYEANVLPRFDFLIVVVDEMKEKFMRRYSLPAEKLITIANFEKKEFAQRGLQSEAEDFSFQEDTFYLLYVGGIDPVRGIETVIEGVAKLRENGKLVEFQVVGSGNQILVDALKLRSKELGVEKSVHFLGQKPFGVVNYFMQKADINVIPHERNEHTDYTIPHKLFQIFLSKRPILVSSCPPLRRYVESADGGWVFKASDSDDFAERVGEIMQTDRRAIDQKVENAYAMVLSDWSWNAEGQRLASFYTSLHG